MRRLNVAVIFGGRSGEHEVSLASAKNVIASLDTAKYRVISICIEKNGRWLKYAKSAGQYPAATKSVSERQRVLVPDRSSRHLRTKDGRAAERIDVAIPLVHGTYGEDGTLQGLLELAGIPYVGSGVLGSAVGMDKVVQKQLLMAAGLPVAKFLHFWDSDWSRRSEQLLQEVDDSLGYPVFVKPANMGSSVGISKAYRREELSPAIVEALRYDTKVLVERSVSRAREIECAVIGEAEPQASELGEIVPSNEFYDYAAKYLDGRSKAIIPAPLPEKVAARLKQYARQVFLLLNASGLARVDFLLNAETGEAFVNEINTIPGFTDVSIFPQLWRASGLSDGQVLDKLIGLALDRSARRAKLETSYKIPVTACP